MRLLPALIIIVGLTPCIALSSPQSDGGSSRAEKIADHAAQKFAQADVNHDGKLTLAEAKQGMPRVAAHFDEIDTQHQGYVTLAQIQAYIRDRATTR